MQLWSGHNFPYSMIELLTNPHDAFCDIIDVIWGFPAWHAWHRPTPCKWTPCPSTENSLSPSIENSLKSPATAICANSESLQDTCILLLEEQTLMQQKETQNFLSRQKQQRVVWKPTDMFDQTDAETLWPCGVLSVFRP